jgi:hypothetical protein
MDGESGQSRWQILERQLYKKDKRVAVETNMALFCFTTVCCDLLMHLELKS